MKQPAHIFLGANSGEGFFSLYEQLLAARLDDLLIIKGGPGCGKSSFMRTVAKALADVDEEIIYVNCSGDPDSLDGVLLPALKTGLVDGTSPHVLEPTYTVANERYVDLTRFYDVAAAKARRDEIIAHSDAYRAAYAEAYHILRAVDAVSAERRSAVHAAMDFDRLNRRIDALVRRELRGRGTQRGRIDRAFLGGMTHKGELCRYDTVQALCPKVCVLADSFGAASAGLSRAAASAASAGYDVLLCPNPDRPRETMHVLIPAAGLALVTETPRVPFEGEAYRRIRVDAIATEKLTRAERSRLRFAGRMERSLRDEAMEALRRAKAEHDELEAAYNPCVDFEGVYALAAEEARRLLTYRK
ncbi:MAG: hypothetical protein IKN81_03135 [Oscillospiraceae bacterium]|nr:hypothetical protein [Oscillospiraceae bacterium]